MKTRSLTRSGFLLLVLGILLLDLLICWYIWLVWQPSYEAGKMRLKLQVLMMSIPFAGLVFLAHYCRFRCKRVVSSHIYLMLAATVPTWGLWLTAVLYRIAFSMFPLKTSSNHTMDLIAAAAMPSLHSSLSSRG